jgi:hypothetical protein
MDYERRPSDVRKPVEVKSTNDSMVKVQYYKTTIQLDHFNIIPSRTVPYDLVLGKIHPFHPLVNDRC